jgi:hypothetical protein
MKSWHLGGPLSDCSCTPDEHCQLPGHGRGVLDMYVTLRRCGSEKCVVTHVQWGCVYCRWQVCISAGWRLLRLRSRPLHQGRYCTAASTVPPLQQWVRSLIDSAHIGSEVHIRAVCMEQAIDSRRRGALSQETTVQMHVVPCIGHSRTSSRIMCLAGGTRVTKPVAFWGHVPKATGGRIRFATPITSRCQTRLRVALHHSMGHYYAFIGHLHVDCI